MSVHVRPLSMHSELVIYLCVTLCVLITQKKLSHAGTRRDSMTGGLCIYIACERDCVCVCVPHWCLKSDGPVHPGSPLKVCSCTQTDTHTLTSCFSLPQLFDVSTFCTQPTVVALCLLFLLYLSESRFHKDNCLNISIPSEITTDLSCVSYW